MYVCADFLHIDIKLFHCCDKIPWPKVWGCLSYYSILHFHITVHYRGSQGRNSQQELKQRPWDNGAYGLPSHGLLSLLSYIAPHELSRGGTSHNGFGPPTSVINEENTTQPCPQTILVRASS